MYSLLKLDSEKLGRDATPGDPRSPGYSPLLFAEGWYGVLRAGAGLSLSV